MKKALWSMLFAGSLLLCLSGCFFQSTDELYALPRSPELYVNLQAEIRRVMGSAEFNAPLTGNNTRTIQLVDLNNDGIQEAVAFFRDTSQEKPLKIYIFAQNSEKNYEEYAHIEGAATDVESIAYEDLSGNGNKELVVSWQVSASVHTLVAYSVDQGQTAELMRSSYTSYHAMDMNGDGKKEILLMQTDSESLENNRVEYYEFQDGAMERVSVAPLSKGGKEITEYQGGLLSDGQSALFVTSAYGESQQIIDVFTLRQGKLRNITLMENSGQSANTLRHFTGVPVQDINGDGITEIPLTRIIPSYAAVSSENFWDLRWWQYDSNGNATLQLTTYHNNSDRWYLVLPPAWEGIITLNRQENTTIGERAVVFSHWDRTSEKPPEAFLIIYRLTGTSRSSGAEGTGRFLLSEDDDVTYVGELLDSEWDCGLTQAELKTQFHLVKSND